MKKLLLPLTILLASGCAATSGKQTVAEAHNTISETLDKVSFTRSLCDGMKVTFFYESMYAYSVRCADNRYFTIKK